MACSLYGGRRGVEQPHFDVVETLSAATEVRRYPSRVAAEVRLPGRDGPLNRGRAFRILYRYITGANAERTGVAMTAPVESADAGRHIAMTAPVQSGGDAADEGYTMRFFLPSTFTMETAPRPGDGRVVLVDVPEQTVAVRRFTGLRGRAQVDRQAALLRRAVAGSRWRPAAADAGAVAAWFYDPPATLPFLRRNEVAMVVSPAEGTGTTTAHPSPDAAG